MRTAEVKVYKFEELGDEAKERALRDYTENGFHYEWWDCTEEFFKQCLKALGIEVDQTFFSGFDIQGDGASFDGGFTFRKDWREVLEKITTGGRLYDACIEAGQTLEEAQTRYLEIPEDDRDGDAIGCDIVARKGRYCHSGMMDIAFIDSTEEDGETILQALTELADEYYFILRDEWEYLTSAEALQETAEANGWEYDESGDMFF